MNAIISLDLNCRKCSGVLKYIPGNNFIKCQYCNDISEIPKNKSAVAERNYFDFTEEKEKTEFNCEIAIIQCKNCGGQTHFSPSEKTTSCLYCGGNITAEKEKWSQFIKPDLILPFSISKDQAETNVKKWISKRQLYSPTNLLKKTTLNKELIAVYLPYWIFTAKNKTEFSKGNYSDSKAKTIFNKFPIKATGILTKEISQSNMKWDFENSIDFNEMYLSGTNVENYTVSLLHIYYKIRQQVNKMTSDKEWRNQNKKLKLNYKKNETIDYLRFNYVLAPIWISTYNYKGKTFKYIVNGRNGSVYGERPKSKIQKILDYALLLLTLIIILIVSFLLIIYLLRNQ